MTNEEEEYLEYIDDKINLELGALYNATDGTLYYEWCLMNVD